MRRGLGLPAWIRRAAWEWQPAVRVYNVASLIEPNSTTRAVLAVVLALSFAVRLSWGLFQPAEIDSRLPDQAEYLQLGRNLLEHGRLSFVDPRFGQEVYAYRTPGYPALIAMFGGNVRLLRVAQACIDTSTVLAAFLLARRWLGAGGSLLAAIAVAVNPFLVYFSGLVLSETLFTAMLTWGLVLMVWRPGGMLGGCVLALACLVRPSALLLPIGLGVASCGLLSRATAARQLTVKALTMLLLTVACFFPWAARNDRVLGEWIWLTTNSGITRYDGFHPQARGDSDQGFLGRPEMGYLKALSEVQRDRELSRLASESIRDDLTRRPGRLARLSLAKMGRTWSPVPLSSDFGGRSLHVFVAAAYCVPFLAACFVGLCRGELPIGARVLLFMPAVYFTVVHVLSVGSLRYRVPVEPLLAVLAASGAMWIMDRAGLRNRSVDA